MNQFPSQIWFMMKFYLVYLINWLIFHLQKVNWRFEMKIASSNSFSFSVKFFFFIFIAFQCVRGFEFLDYTEAHVFNCTNPDNPPPGVLILHEIDRYLYMIICPITLCASSFIIFTFIKYPGIRNSPGDLLLAISLCEFLLNLHWFISSITTVAEGGPP